jgi:predicted small secreted protein
MVLTKGQQAELFSIANGNTQGGNTTNITINAGAGTDIDSLAQAVTDAVERANVLGLEPQG